ncbi:hypothetical protein CDCA_CDCA15G4059 [Cyanidium caldarium]|uniref:Glycolipid transfer protein domain-containing protein n=1 Tax=Cyanidium caldarium TaxID=2771 RepID=A0AAV9J0K5_CYACA|nr:hypothetical protein CDCA_CDCA15G4059 [Cyanidium caldarium]
MMPDERTSSVQRHESPDGLTGRLKQLIREGKRLFLCAGGLGSESLGRVAESVRPPRAPTRSNTSWQGRGNGDRSHATDSLGHSVKPRPPDLTRRSVALGSPLERSDASANGRLAVSTPGQGRTMRARHWRASSESSVSFVVADVFEVPEGPLGRDAVDQSVLPSAPAGDGRAVAFIDQLRASVLTPWRRQNWWARTVCILALLTWGAYVQWPRWTLVLPALLAILLPWGNATWDALRHNRRSKVFERDRAPHATENAAATRRVPEEAHPPSPKRLPVGVSPRSLRTPDTSLFDASRDASFSEKRSLETSAMGKEANAASPQAVRGVDARFQSSPPRPPKATPAAFQELQPARIFHHVFSALGVESAQAHVPARPRTPTPSSSSLGEGDDDDVANEGDVPPIDIQSSSVTDDSRYETPDASVHRAGSLPRPSASLARRESSLRSRAPRRSKDVLSREHFLRIVPTWTSMRITGNQELMVDDFCDGLMCLMPVVDALGTAFRIIKLDVRSKTADIRKAATKLRCATLQRMVELEMSQSSSRTLGLLARRTSGTESLLWMKRMVQFVYFFIWALHRGVDMRDSVYHAYLNTLKPCHPFVVQRIAGNLHRIVPDWLAFANKLHAEPEQVRVHMEALLRVMETRLDLLVHFYNERDLETLCTIDARDIRQQVEALMAGKGER